MHSHSLSDPVKADQDSEPDSTEKFEIFANFKVFKVHICPMGWVEDHVLTWLAIQLLYHSIVFNLIRYGCRDFWGDSNVEICHSIKAEELKRVVW